VPKIPLQTLRHPTIVVHDARATALNYADFFGITTWQVRHLGPDRLQQATVRGRVPTAPPPANGMVGESPIPGAYGFISALGTSPNGNIMFELVQPTSGLSTFEEFLVTRGQGIHGLCATVLGAKEFDELRPLLAENDIRIAQSYRLGKAEHYYLDMRKPLANFFLEVVVPSADDWPTAVAPDEVWDLSGEVTRPKDVNAAINAVGITHFGCVIDNLQERLPNFARIFGENVWRGMNWHTAPGSLEDTTTNGRPVVHGYFTGRADLGTNRTGALPFGFEVIQPTYGPSHYKEDFLLVLGPGLHHIDVRTPMADWAEWERTNVWMDERFGAPTCMSGWLRNKSALFHYKDTRQKLGFVTELSAPRRTDAPVQRWQPDYWYDFSAVAR
jgi:hypothetical protein